MVGVGRGGGAVTTPCYMTRWWCRASVRCCAVVVRVVYGDGEGVLSGWKIREGTYWNQNQYFTTLSENVRIVWISILMFERSLYLRS